MLLPARRSGGTFAFSKVGTERNGARRMTAENYNRPITMEEFRREFRDLLRISLMQPDTRGKVYGVMITLALFCLLTGYIARHGRKVFRKAGPVQTPCRPRHEFEGGV